MTANGIIMSATVGMQPPPIPGSAVRYALVGLVNTMVGLGVIYFAMYFLEFSDVRANALGYLVGVIVSFLLNRQWTFRDTGPIGPALARFLAVLLVAYCANLGSVLALVELAAVNRYLAQAAGVLPYVVVGYLGSRYFAFRAPEDSRVP